MSTVIKVENLSKQYRLGQVGTGTISHDVNRWWHKFRGKEDPYLKIGDSNERTIKGESDYVWALKDINFEVQQGEVLGIIGRNGAGKSTLLKILSRTTSPSTGSVKIKGRVASLLEVGTGFHPELSGRDNIFLNGAILGMTRREIQSKFDEIVDFAGVERYIDTPVKRYSSGMYVRLAFAVAAHLEPEILIVDEVLAVGDAEFQKKCLGKMKDVSVKEGRTVLFVSHNMAAVKQLCTSCIVVENGKLLFEGDSKAAVSHYQTRHNAASSYKHPGNIDSAPGNELFRLLNLEVYCEGTDQIDIDSGFSIKAEFINMQIYKTLGLSFVIRNEDELVICEMYKLFASDMSSKAGKYTIEMKFPMGILNSGRYSIDVLIAESQKYMICEFEKILVFDIENAVRNSSYSLNRIQGIIRPNYSVEITYEEDIC